MNTHRISLNVTFLLALIAPGFFAAVAHADEKEDAYTQAVAEASKAAKAGDWLEAFGAAKVAIKAKPDGYQGHYLAAYALWKLNQPEKAKAEAAQAFELAGANQKGEAKILVDAIQQQATPAVEGPAPDAKKSPENAELKEVMEFLKQFVDEHADLYHAPEPADTTLDVHEAYKILSVDHGAIVLERNLTTPGKAGTPPDRHWMTESIDLRDLNPDSVKLLEFNSDNGLSFRRADGSTQRSWCFNLSVNTTLNKRKIKTRFTNNGSLPSFVNDDGFAIKIKCDGKDHAARFAKAFAHAIKLAGGKPDPF